MLSWRTTRNFTRPPPGASPEPDQHAVQRPEDERVVAVEEIVGEVLRHEARDEREADRARDARARGARGCARARGRARRGARRARGGPPRPSDTVVLRKRLWPCAANSLPATSPISRAEPRFDDVAPEAVAREGTLRDGAGRDRPELRPQVHRDGLAGVPGRGSTPPASSRGRGRRRPRSPRRGRRPSRAACGAARAAGTGASETPSVARDDEERRPHDAVLGGERGDEEHGDAGGEEPGRRPRPAGASTASSARKGAAITRCVVKRPAAGVERHEACGATSSRTSPTIASAAVPASSAAPHSRTRRGVGGEVEDPEGERRVDASPGAAPTGCRPDSTLQASEAVGEQRPRGREDRDEGGRGGPASRPRPWWNATCPSARAATTSRPIAQARRRR